LRPFSASAHSQPECAAAWAPGRVNLIGEHTDYNGGCVFPMALEMGVAVYFRPRRDKRVRLFAANVGEMGEFSLPRIVRSKSQPWLNYPMGVAKELLEEGLRLRGIDGVIDGDLPVGGGLGSSAALEVASALAFLEAAGENLARVKLARLCQRAENHFVGLKCGIMDQFVALFAQPGSALFLDTRSLLYRPVPLPRPDEYVIVICDSGVKHTLAGSEYNLRRKECEKALAILKAPLPDIRALGEVSPAQFRAHQGLLPQPLRKRAKHVILENERTRRGGEALEKGAIAAFGQLMNESHESLQNLYEVSCKELDLLVELARSIPGVAGSRMTGGGFGGCTVSLMKRAGLGKFQKRVPAAYKKATGVDCRIFVSAAAGAAVVGRGGSEG